MSSYKIIRLSYGQINTRMCMCHSSSSKHYHTVNRGGHQHCMKLYCITLISNKKIVNKINASCEFALGCLNNQQILFGVS